MVRSSRIAGIISLFAVGASAVAIKRQDTSKWTATKYQWGCSPGGCSATFNLEGPKNYPLGAPAFSVVCSPVYIQQDWVECKNPDGSDMGASSKVYSVWQAGPDEQEQYISIAHIYNNGSWYEARSGPNGLLPEKGATIFFVVNSVVPAADNHLPPPTKTASPTLGVHLGENGEPASTNQGDKA
nr:uncharacterized protein CTRU02_01222 [Colletotrichum truncatum]KAF6800816.1 hypothetical protein CTRU02_01222 [Colletotrichum truncatum]